jgi:hypothetical protein
MMATEVSAVRHLIDRSVKTFPTESLSVALNAAVLNNMTVSALGARMTETTGAGPGGTGGGIESSGSSSGPGVSGSAPHAAKRAASVHGSSQRMTEHEFVRDERGVLIINITA